MNKGDILMCKDLRGHFAKRARDYNHSSRWVADKLLIRKIRELAEPGPEACVLDIGIGTGKIAQAFCGCARYVVGVDICPEMTRYAKRYADRILLTPAEKLPFKNDVFDVCVCRQGMQFMKPNAVLSEIYRVLKPGGCVILCHLTAYGRGDKRETFLIQKLRNPARKNFFLPEDFERLLKKKPFTDIENFEHITRESVNQWIRNCAIDVLRKKKIKEVYVNSSQIFRKLHNIEFKDGDIFDSMKMVIVKAKKKMLYE